MSTPTPGTPAGAVVEAIDDMYAAWVERDWERFDAHLSGDVVAWESHLPEPIRGLDQLAAHRATRPAPTVMREFRAHGHEVDVWGETAVARYLLVGEPLDPAAPRREARVTEVLRWDGERWRITRRHAEAR
ncbi:YybH family protein [Kineococcus sp. SYSU DK018]|uniref:YybH family protein n=1 Tax=Kineococcus sp. SYSU DK018 TaxID=3383139 RepID=UPI003D7D0D1D